MKRKKIKHKLWFFLLVGFVAGLLAGVAVWFGRSTIDQNSPLYPIDLEYQEPHAFSKPPKDVVLALPPEALFRQKTRIPIIMYHYVENVKDPNDKIRKSLSVRPDALDGELNSLKEASFSSYFVRDIPHILDGSIGPYDESKSVVLTFDDGYEDFYTDAFPIIKKYNMKATIFIIYDFIGSKGFLTKKEIEELVKSGLVEVGSHTLDHAYLKGEPEDIARRQITDSKADLEKDFGVQVTTFAYPFGAFSQQTIDLMKQAHYEAAVSEIPGVMQNTDNILYLSRIRAGTFTAANITHLLESFNN